jgi:hypothetical protein
MKLEYRDKLCGEHFGIGAECRAAGCDKISVSHRRCEVHGGAQVCKFLSEDNGEYIAQFLKRSSVLWF